MAIFTSYFSNYLIYLTEFVVLELLQRIEQGNTKQKKWLRNKAVFFLLAMLVRIFLSVAKEMYSGLFKHN